jgi:integrase
LSVARELTSTAVKTPFWDSSTAGQFKMVGMYLEKRGAVWSFEFVRDGVRYRRSTGLRNKNKAIQFAEAYRTNLTLEAVGIKQPKSAPTFKAAMADFLTWSKGHHKEKPATTRRYHTSAVALLKHFKDITLDQIDAEAVERYKAARSKQFATVRGKSVKKRKQTTDLVKPATVNRELACLRAVFNHAIKGNDALKNPISRTGARSLPEENQQTRVLTFDEESRYLAVATPFLRDVATLMLQTGMRPEEVYRIQPHNVNLTDGWVFNPYGKTKAAKRRIALTSAAKVILTRRMVDCGPYLFPHDSDPKRPVPKVNNAHDRAIRGSRIAPARLYDLRHTWATRAVEAGIDLVTLAAMLGHSKIAMVMRYAHPSQAHQTSAMEKMERFVAAQQSPQNSPQAV